MARVRYVDWDGWNYFKPFIYWIGLDWPELARIVLNWSELASIGRNSILWTLKLDLFCYQEATNIHRSKRIFCLDLNFILQNLKFVGHKYWSKRIFCLERLNFGQKIGLNRPWFGLNWSELGQIDLDFMLQTLKLVFYAFRRPQILIQTNLLPGKIQLWTENWKNWKSGPNSKAL